MEVNKIITDAAKIIKKNARPQSVVLFGSWTNNTALPTSDIDIGILDKQKIPFSVMIKIKQEIENIPTLRSIDIVDLNAVDDRFKKYALIHAKKI
ncbi:MAG: hypothetical protein A2233_05460 [Candidatus Kerfeldbacteria bacterium RIFOXYA2_FULL_38_24]|uniref:Polymerase beta nucleotidyltransferase domain-containing protein n=1 Tax=Candidatus Kerfeldbacteria bacterium RIFOXYB2_FULL_38_14 TaxID=1798547 RepID=A0A1G2BGH9_9BACT|nr:MAG: hypothetical protein A2233_05460 [Candidatus Kerfeldbacteria bacterium RIFOXYA2_FULL_38_24]OGY88274.1 MAG: hypothetical protein A2319_03745 [Candidatus Kerfeldbacteria bacterium RIFOXYB2_FULL_38_14]OGY89649.1 MAG: hypothetical protein A2458_04305 [Candidatus Kerfeldbacteria bacterium RIFOXYC2_FULL_38_9]